MASSGAAQAAGQGPGELKDLREQLLAVAKTESELRQELTAARAQIAQLAQNEALARSLLKESHSLTRALHERARLETDAATAVLRESLEAERAKSQAELARATDELRTRRNRPDAEMETLRALFADLMRGEALGRQRLERLQQQVAEHERQRQELQLQLDLERDARRKAEAELLPGAPPPIPAGAVAGPIPSSEHEQVRQLETAVAELEKRHAALGRELAEERGAGQAQAERAAAEVEWARERAQAAAESEQEAKDALFEARKQFAQTQEKLREDADERERAAAQFADQLAGLRKKIEDERERANAEIARRVQAVETLQVAVSAADAAAKKAAATIEEREAVAARLQAEVGRLESARDAAQDAARDVSMRERRTAVELAETQTRAKQLASQLDELRQALAARTEGESAARAATALAERERDEVHRALASLETALAELRATSAQQALMARNELAEAGHLKQALAQELTDVRGQLEKSETARAALEAAVAGIQEELHRASGEARAQQDDLVRKLEDVRAQLAAAKAEQARLSAESERLGASAEERGRTAEALAGELGLARGEAETLQGALDRSGVALASLQARHSRLEADLTQAQHERDEEARSRVEQAARLHDEQSQAAGQIAELEAALAQKDAQLIALHRARADEVAAIRAQRDAEQKQLAAELSVETTRAENALRESQGLLARCDTSARELAEAAQRMRAAETDAAQAKAEQERLRAIASARREALIAELDGRFADAEALLQAQLGQSLAEASVLLQLGRLHHAWAEGAPGSHEEIAERLLTRAAELDLYDATAPLYLGHVRLRRGRHGAAREAYRETIDRDPQCAPAHEALAVLSVRSMKHQARIAFAAAIVLLLSSAALFIHRFVQGPAPAASALSESQERRAKSEVVPYQRSHSFAHDPEFK